MHPQLFITDTIIDLFANGRQSLWTQFQLGSVAQPAKYPLVPIALLLKHHLLVKGGPQVACHRCNVGWWNQPANTHSPHLRCIFWRDSQTVRDWHDGHVTQSSSTFGNHDQTTLDRLTKLHVSPVEFVVADIHFVRNQTTQGKHRPNNFTTVLIGVISRSSAATANNSPERVRTSLPNGEFRHSLPDS